MWEFLGTVLETQGLIAAVLLVVIGSAGFAMRELWKKNQELGVQYRKMLSEEAEKRHTMRDAHDLEVAALREELRELHEKRNAETRETVREMIQVANELRGSAATTAEVLTFMRETITRRDR